MFSFKFKKRTQEQAHFEFTGSCPIREHTGDGGFVGRCEYATYEGVCPRHGNVSKWLVPQADLQDADDRLLVPHAERDYGSQALRDKLGVRFPVR